MMAADTMEALGIPRGSYVVKVSNRKVLDGVMESIGLGGNENAGRRLTVLRAIDKMDKFSIEEIAKLLGPGRWDGGEEGKGDFTSGAGLEKAQILELLRVVGPDTLHSTHIENYKGAAISDNEFSPNLGESYVVLNSLVLNEWEPILKNSKTGQEGLRELREMAELFAGAGYGTKRIRISPSVVRGLEYYTGPVYEVELTLETRDEKGRPVRFGSVGGGGRYDGLVSRFRGEPVPATGFSIGVSRLQAALSLLGKLDTRAEFGPVVVTVFDRDRVADYQKMVAALRGANIRAELYLGNPKHALGQQMKYADRRGSPCAIIQGSDEKARGEVLIKDLIVGAEIAGATSEREDYLKRQAEAQFAVAEDKLVDAVRDLLKRHGIHD
jgi:histidyl-tRNA synthetase